MDENRRQIIIHEIGFWKNNRLLPEQYCDFLLALYTEGDRIEPKKINKNGSKNHLLWFLLIPVSLFFIYFTELSLILQIGISIILLFLGISLTMYLAKSGFLYQIPLVISAFIFLFVSVELTKTFLAKETISLYVVLFLNCLIWIFSGIRLKLIYFTISGVFAFLLLTGSIFFYYF